MTGWLYNGLVAVVALWLASAAMTALVMQPFGQRRLARFKPILGHLAQWTFIAGLLALAGLVGWLWYTLGRPPLRTMGETRLWYSLLLAAIGLLTEWRLGTRAMRLPMLAAAVAFIFVNLFSPDLLDRTLMPALQSPWFVPHVVVYMAGYAALGLSCAVSLWTLARGRIRRAALTDADARLAELLVYLGLPLVTLGMCFGALWAKEAWGHYWSWDPKETWAFVSWAAYCGVIHLRRDRAGRPRAWLWVNAAAFVTILACWFLVNYLPAGRVSIHAYS